VEKGTTFSRKKTFPEKKRKNRKIGEGARGGGSTPGGESQGPTPNQETGSKKLGGEGGGWGLKRSKYEGLQMKKKSTTELWGPHIRRAQIKGKI